MNISFYTTPPPPANGKLIFNEEFAQFMVGQTVKHNGHNYQVNALQWADDSRKNLNAYCQEVSERITQNIFKDI